jgi:SAM-dependent methyltransferase
LAGVGRRIRSGWAPDTPDTPVGPDDRPIDPDDPFDLGLAGRRCRLRRDGAPDVRLDTRRWRADAARSDRWLLDACRGHTVDLGCGPGRLVAALIDRGVPALGVDTSPRAIAQSLRRGAPALHRDVFDAMPGEGRWGHVLLADGNVGIGGDPVALLRRVRRLLGRDGSVLVELCPREPGLWRGTARIVADDGRLDGPPFPWSQVGVAAIGEVAAGAGLTVRRTHRPRHRRRAFAELCAG